MKKLVVLSIVIFSVNLSYSQIHEYDPATNNSPKLIPKIQAYDSLAPVHMNTRFRQVGPYLVDRGNIAFDEQDIKFEGQRIYLAVETPLYRLPTTDNPKPYVSGKEKYYVITRVLDNETSVPIRLAIKNLDMDIKDGLVEIVDLNTSDTLFLAYSDYKERIISVGFYEKMKSLLVGKSFVAYAKRYNTGQYYIEDFVTGDKISTNDLAKMTFVCEDINIHSKTYEAYVIAIMRSDNTRVTVPVASYNRINEGRVMPKEYGRLLITDDDNKGKGYLKNKPYYFFHESWWSENILKEIQSDLIKIYGNTYGRAILEGKVLTGMTRDMCLKAWSSDSYNNGWGSRSWSQQTNNGTWQHEKGVIKFINGKVSSVTLY